MLQCIYYRFLALFDTAVCREAMYVGYIGQLFLNMLKCIIIPLVIPSLIAAIGKCTFSHKLINVVNYGVFKSQKHVSTCIIL
jgi:Na+/H+-dicarboxylate symporter